MAESPAAAKQAGPPRHFLILIHDGSAQGRKRLNRELAGAQAMLGVMIRKAVKAFGKSNSPLMVYMHERSDVNGKSFYVRDVEQLATDLFPRIFRHEMKEGDAATFLLAAAPDVEQQITVALRAAGQGW